VDTERDLAIRGTLMGLTPLPGPAIPYGLM
jgi:hypothetical protein